MSVVASKGHQVALPLIVVTAGIAALFLIVTYVLPALQTEVTAVRNTPALPPSVALAPSPAQQDAPAALATTQSEVTAALADLGPTPALPPAEQSSPAFDLARIEGTGDAVLAGRAPPGAMVELLRNGQPLQEQTAADASGQFVIVSRLPPGSYDLSLRSKAPDGTIALSAHGIPVAVNGPATSAALPSRTDAATANRQEAAASPSLEARAAVSPPLEARPAVSPPLEARAAAPAPEAPASNAPQPQLAAVDTATGATAGKPGIKIVSRGDSLWRISRLTYGDGTRYTVIYKANRNRIHDPNRIYPGQTFVLPGQSSPR